MDLFRLMSTLDSLQEYQEMHIKAFFAIFVFFPCDYQAAKAM